MRYVDEGTGPAVVFLHGLAADLDTFAAQAAHLRGRYRCIRPDLRGHGGSSTPPGPWAIEDLAADVARLLASLGVDHAHFVGHSAGGVVASRLVLDRPDLVRSLCLVATAPECNEKAANEFYLRWAGIAENEGMAAALRAMGAKRLPDESKMGDALGFARGCRAIATLYPEPLTPRLAAVRVPALVVVGEKDWIGVGGSVKAHRALAGSELVILPGLGHQPFTQDPEGFNARLDAFLAGVEGGSPTGLGDAATSAVRSTPPGPERAPATLPSSRGQDHPAAPAPREAERSDDRDGAFGTTAGRVSLALIALAVAAVAIWQSGEERRAVRSMAGPERAALFEKEYAALVAACAEPTTELHEHCRSSARFVELFPECGPDCRDRTGRILGREIATR